MYHIYDPSRSQALKHILAEAEASVGTDAILSQVRRLCLTDFCELLLGLPDTTLPNISQALPHTPPDEEQRIWTGSAGHELLQDTISFTRILNERSRQHRKQPLTGARILDYGCGFGRILRAMLYFTDPDKLFGVDPWDRSIEICRQHGVLASLAQSEFLPDALPVEGLFDVAYSYSVFTHLSPRATRAALGALRKSISNDGFLAITIRDVEFWSRWGPSAGFSAEKIEALIKAHNSEGFAYAPSDLAPVDGDVTFGNTSISWDWFAQNAPAWRVVDYDRGIDYSQPVLILRPV